MQEILIFILSFLIPMLFFRTFYLITNHTEKFSLDKKTGFRIHHAHFGLISILISSIMLLFLNKNTYVIALLGLGLGLSLDEFIPALQDALANA